uniref:Uncharacterized protein n=1 Tax=Anguilla anguilla TaxID=7936 RepID=A0A0E9TSW9_ANGAN
MNRMSKIFLV